MAETKRADFTHFFVFSHEFFASLTSFLRIFVKTHDVLASVMILASVRLLASLLLLASLQGLLLLTLMLLLASL
jgi:hypothetical protein